VLALYAFRASHFSPQFFAVCNFVNFSFPAHNPFPPLFFVLLRLNNAAVVN